MASLDWAQCSAVESVADRRSGAWVFRDTRTPVSVVFDNLEAGTSIGTARARCRAKECGILTAKADSCFGCPWRPTLLCPSVIAQTTESTLRKLFHQENKDSFLVEPGVKIKVVYGPSREVCVLTISGLISEANLMRTFEKAVPSKSRGVYLGRISECMGICIQRFTFEKVEVTSGVIGSSQISEPAANVIFKRRECHAAASAAITIVSKPARN